MFLPSMCASDKGDMLVFNFIFSKEGPGGPRRAGRSHFNADRVEEAGRIRRKVFLKPI